MSVLEIISAVLLILSCVFIIVVVLMQDSKKGMSQAITGSSGDNYYQKNSGRTKEARLKKWTRTAAIVFFVVTALVNVISIYFAEDNTIDLGTIEVTTAADDSTTEAPEEETEEPAETEAPAAE